MGSGKSTTGRRLAACLKWSFIDLDREIEKNTGRKIKDIFQEMGEHYFRLSESDALQKTKSVSKAVISTGGGAPCFGENMKFMVDNGLTVYLKLTPEQLHERLINSRGERPLLQGIQRNELLKYISAKLTDREKWYSEADIVIDGYNTGFNELCGEVKRLIR